MKTSSEIAKALNYVRQDIDDDFWPDVINYNDYFLENTKRLPKDYRPKGIYAMDIPKVTMILRPGHFIDIQDRVYFQLQINKIAKRVDKKMVSGKVSYGYRIHQTKDKYFFQHNITNWLNFQKKSNELFTKSPSGLLIKTDINAFFEHIVIDKLIENLKNEFNVETKKIESILRAWAPNGIGIPQGNNCSSFLANVYLDSVDKSMTRMGYDYYRFVDDMHIFIDNEKMARQAIRELTALLKHQ